MISLEDKVRQQCVQVLQRIAWRLQYKQRQQWVRERLIFEDRYSSALDANFESQLYVQELLTKIPSAKGQYIIRRLLLDGFTEREVAIELQISQQAVSKWRKKGLEILRQQILRQQLHPSSPC